MGPESAVLAWLARRNWTWVLRLLVRPQLVLAELERVDWPSLRHPRRRALALMVQNRGRSGVTCRASVRVVRGFDGCYGFTSAERPLQWQDGEAEYHLDAEGAARLPLVLTPEKDHFDRDHWGRLMCGVSSRWSRGRGITVGNPAAVLATPQALDGQETADTLCMGDFELEVVLRDAANGRTLARRRFILQATSRVSLIPTDASPVSRAVQGWPA